jgi:NodT family efflux transporter outer membrane factor (OMF) lipoprotein
VRAVSQTALLLLLICAGCRVGPTYTRPSAPVPPAFTENDQWKTAHPNDGELRGNWWEMFNDPKLNELEQMVNPSNQTVKQAEAQFRQARALVALNRAQYFPTIGAAPAISTGLSSTRAGSGTAVASRGVTTQYTLPLSVSWEPDLWGRVRLAVENASASAQASAADLENVRLSLQTELATDYFLLRGIDMQLALLNSNITGYERALQLTINRFNGGVASKTDVLQAQTQLDSTKAQATDLGVTRAQDDHAIAVLTGRPPEQLAIPLGDIKGLPPPIPAAVPSQLLERRPDIAGAERRVAAANAEIGLAQTAFYPTLSLTGSAGFTASSFLNWFTWPSRFFSVGPALSQTLFDFGRRRAQVQISEAAYDALVAAYRQTVLGAFQEVEDNLAALRILEQEAAQQQSAVTASEQSLQLEIDRYKAGTVSYLDVITSQTIALTNERAAVTILRNRMTAAVQLIKGAGGGWNASTLPSPDALRSPATADPSKVAQPKVAQPPPK